MRRLWIAGPNQCPAIGIRKPLLWLLSLFPVLVGGIWTYALRVNHVTPFHAHLPPAPAQNGYAMAAAIVARLPPRPAELNTLNWPPRLDGRAAATVRSARPFLDALCATYRLPWRAPPEEVLARSAPSLLGFWPAGEFLAADSELALRSGDPARAMARSLDALELAGRVVRGGCFGHLQTALGCERVGFPAAERAIATVHAAVIPPAISRVRAIRTGWPGFGEIVESQRQRDLAGMSQICEAYQNGSQPLGIVQGVIERGPLYPGPDWWMDTLQFWLTPKQELLHSIDLYYRRVEGEEARPFAQRRPVPTPEGRRMEFKVRLLSWNQNAWWRIRSELDLLTVALAVEQHRRERGGYPRDLREVSHRWLPAVPIDPWGHRIAYRRRRGRPLIYSFGPDGKDDGGQALPAPDIEAGARGDLVFGATGEPWPR
jgi:hypothetical protein